MNGFSKEEAKAYDFFLLQALFKSHCICFYIMGRGFLMAKLREHCTGLCKRTAWSNIFDEEFAGQKK